MGTWGTGLYSDDTACDVRDDYKEILGDGISEPEATDLLIDKWKDSLADPDISPVFWLALADVQWNLGRLQEKVKKEAINSIENGSDLTRWSSNQRCVVKRKAVLAHLWQKLESPQPPEKVVRKRYVDSTDWNIGDVYRFRLRSGLLVWLHVIGFHQDNGGRMPVCEVLEWTGEKIPSKLELEKTGFVSAKEPHQGLSQFLFGSLGPKDFPKDRISLVIKGVKPKQKTGGYAAILWRLIDRQFDELFGLK